MQTIYFHDHKPGKIQFTLCGVIIEDGTLNVGVTLRSPKDRVFCKATGRKIAYARAIGKPYDVIESFVKFHGSDNLIKAAMFHLQGVAGRIIGNPDVIKEISQLYHANAGLKKGQTKIKPRFEMAI